MTLDSDKRPGSSGQGRLRPERGQLESERVRAGLLLMLPAALVVGVLVAVPIFQAIYYSMTNWNGITSQWVGPSTYMTLFRNPTFWRVLENNGLLLISVPVAILIPLGIAAMINQKVWGWKLFRSLIFLPTAISWVVIGMVAVRIFADPGAVNSLLGAVGLGFLQRDFLAQPATAILAVALTFIWSMIGTNTIIFLTGMSTIDPAIFEAAAIDGAARWSTFIRITIPLLKRYFQFSFVLTVITAFTALFSLIFIMTGGGPDYGTTTLEFFIYQQAFSVGDFGTGAMIGVVLFVLLFGISIVQLRLLRGEH